MCQSHAYWLTSRSVERRNIGPVEHHAPFQVVQQICRALGEQAARGEARAVRDYQTLLVEAAVREKIARLSALERFQLALGAGAKPGDFFSAGQLNAGGQRFLADEIGHVILPRLKELKF